MYSDPRLNRIPVVVASNLGQESDIEKVRRFGVMDYYVKVRVSVDDIVKMLAKILKREPEAKPTGP